MNSTHVIDGLVERSDELIDELELLECLLGGDGSFADDVEEFGEVLYDLLEEW